MWGSGGAAQPPVSRTRVRYTKTGKVRFISAIDLGRVWERALRKADLPIAYSEGFSPHPKVSFPDALPLGYASTGEYAELTFAAPVALPPAVAALNAAFPDGVRVLAAVAVDPGHPRLSRWLQVSTWDMQYPDGTEPAGAVRQADASAVLTVSRQRKGEPVDVDLRPAIFQLSCRGERVRVTLHHAEHQPGPVAGLAVRPTEVDLALRRFQPDLPEPVLVTRIAQGRAVPEGLLEALGGELVPPLVTQHTTQKAHL